MTLPVILHSGEGQSVKIGTSSCTFKLTGKDTHGHFGLFEFILEPETDGPRPHIHKQMTEIFYVIEGELELVLGQQRITAVSGTLMSVPENTPHGFSNLSKKKSEVLNYVLSRRFARAIFYRISRIKKRWTTA